MTVSHASRFGGAGPRAPRRAAPLLAVLLYAAAAAGAAAEEGPVTLVAVGDMPYRTEDFARFEDLLDAINADPPDLTIHVGDIKSSGTPCTDAAFERQRDYMDSLAGPLLYTPGDNEWTDCHRPTAGGYDPLERLTRLRAMFFDAPRSRGRAPVAVVRQADEDPARALYVENMRWTHRGVVFATIHAVGSNDGDNAAIPGAVAEHEARSAAGQAWMARAFAVARDEGARALVLAFQGDPFQTPMQRARYGGYLETLAEGAREWHGPVLVIHGDGHVYTVDTPFHAPGGGALDVLRLEVPGAKDIRAVRVTIDPTARKTFEFAPFGPGAD